MTGGSGRSSMSLALHRFSSYNGLVVGLSSRWRNSRSSTSHPSSTVPLARPSPRSLRCTSPAPIARATGSNRSRDQLLRPIAFVSRTKTSFHPPCFREPNPSGSNPPPHVPLLGFSKFFPSASTLLEDRALSAYQPLAWSLLHEGASLMRAPPLPFFPAPTASSLRGRQVCCTLSPAMGFIGFQVSSSSSFPSLDGRSLSVPSLLADASPCGAFPSPPAGAASPRHLCHPDVHSSIARDSLRRPLDEQARPRGFAPVGKSRSSVQEARAPRTRRSAPLGFLPLQGLPPGSCALPEDSVVAHQPRTTARPRSLRCSGAISFAARSPCPIAGAAGSSRAAALARSLPHGRNSQVARSNLPSTSTSVAEARMGVRSRRWGPSEILRSRVAFVLPHLGPIHREVNRSGVARALQRPAPFRILLAEYSVSVADAPAPRTAVRPWSPT